MTVGLGWVALAALGAFSQATVPDAGGAVHEAAAAGLESFLPHLVSGGFVTPVTPTPFGTPPGPTPWPTWPPRPTRPPRPRLDASVQALATAAPSVDGMVSFGESVIELQNLTEDDLTVQLGLHSLNLFDDVALTRDLAPMAAVSIELKANPDVTYSEYAARVHADGDHGSLARTAWSSGAMAVYEAAEPATELMLPLFALEVYSHTTFLHLTNTNPTAYDDILMQVYDSDGSVLCEWTFGLGPGESGTVDPYERAEFAVLPGNVGEGYLGAVRFQSDRKTAIVAYGDDWEGRGVSAFRARPVDRAESEQYLPVVRANVAGNSLIAVANATGRANEVTITYLGAPDSPAGAGQSFEQTLVVGPWQGGFVDLDPGRPRGSFQAPALPRGVADGAGFLGSAVVRGTGAILATVLEQDARPLGPPKAYTVLASAAYDGFGSSDLSPAWVVPRVHDGSLRYRTEIAVMNPRSRPVTFRVDWGRLPSQLVGSSGAITLAANQMTVVPIPADAGLEAQAVVRADAPVAVLVRDCGPELDPTAYRPLMAPEGWLAWLPTAAPPATATTPSSQATTAPSSTAPTRRPSGRDIHLPVARRR